MNFNYKCPPSPFFHFYCSRQGHACYGIWLYSVWGLCPSKPPATSQPPGLCRGSWWFASTAQQWPKPWCVISTLLPTNTRHNTKRTDLGEVNSVPERPNKIKCEMLLSHNINSSYQLRLNLKYMSLGKKLSCTMVHQRKGRSAPVSCLSLWPRAEVCRKDVRTGRHLNSLFPCMRKSMAPLRQTSISGE